MNFGKSTTRGFLAYFLVTVACMCSFLVVHETVASSPALSGSHYSQEFQHVIDNDQYARLADALIKGNLNLDLPVPETLAALDNPYDFDSRLQASEDGENPIYWDHAFYQGKYYCYFGVVPAILLFVPYQLATGNWLYTPNAIAVLGVAFVLAAAMLVRRIGKRYFADSATEGSLCLALLALAGGSNVMYLGYVSRFYSVPLLMSMMLTMLGLWFWMGARKDKLPGAKCRQPSLSSWRLAAGSFCMMLNFGSRPQFVLACFLAFPLFWDEIVHQRLLFSSRGWRQTLAALLPAVIILAVLMWYNYARFGGIINYGSNYNLTGFDMTEYQQSWRLTPLLLFFYLLQPWSISTAFPYIQATDLSYPVGWAPTEPMFGGYLWLVPLALAVLFLPSVRTCLKERKLWGPSLALLVFAGVVLLIDARHAGVTQRYFSDFGCYAMLISVFVMLSWQAQAKAGEGFGARHRKAVIACVVLALSVSVVVGGLSFLSPERYDSIVGMNPVLWEAITSVF